MTNAITLTNWERVESIRRAMSRKTPTYSSWLNQVELWFGKIERDVIARGVFTSVNDLRRKLIRYIRLYNNAPRIVKWRYADPRRHISTKSSVTGH
jgi:transposase